MEKEISVSFSIHSLCHLILYTEFFFVPICVNLFAGFSLIYILRLIFVIYHL